MTARPEFGAAIAVEGVRLPWLPDDVWDQVQATLFCGEVQEAGNDTNPDMSDWEWSDIQSIQLPVPRYDFVYLALERGCTPWFGGDEAPGDWDGGTVLKRAGYMARLNFGRTSCMWENDGEDEDVIGYHATSTALPLAHPAALSEPETQTALGDLPSRIQGWIGKAKNRGSDRIELDFATVELLVRLARLAHPAAPQGEEVDANGNMNAPVERAKYDELERDFAAIRKDYGKAAYLIEQMRERWNVVAEQLDHVSGGMHASLEDAASAMASICDNPRAALAPAAIASGRGEGE